MATMPFSALLVLLATIGAHAKTIDVNLQKMGYKQLLASGQKVGDVVFGQLRTYDGKQIMANNYEAGEQLSKPDISTAPDYTAIVKVGSDIYASVVTDFMPPSQQYLAKLSMTKSGDLEVADLKYVNWSSVGGLWLACSGSVLLSGTHHALIMGAEEYENNARHLSVATNLTHLRSLYETDPYYYGYADVVNHMRYFGKYPFANNLSLPVLTFADVKAKFNPYMYGYITAMTLKAKGQTSVTKYMTMGRFSHELGYVMPDRKTVYLTDDHSNGGGFFKFVAKAPGVFTSGTLYAMKVNQTVASGADAATAAFDVSWVKLGTANNADLMARAKKTTFANIFETANGDTTSGACPSGFTSVNTATGFECLKLKAGKELEAAFFESRRYAALLGATTEFSKAEGITFDKDTKSLYVAISTIRDSMEDYKKKGSPKSTFDIGGPNHIRLAYNPCGCIFKATVDMATYDIRQLRSAVCGVPISSDAAGNSCSTASIAGPDNLSMLGGQLVIAEDSEGRHINNLMWALDLKKNNSLTQVYRIQNGQNYTEAEFTATYPYTIGGNTYLSTAVNNWDFNAGVNGQVGYFGPLRINAADSVNFVAYDNSIRT